jgi:hypothetical protein
LDVVRTRRRYLFASGVKIHFVGVDVPTNRVVARVESGLLQCRSELSDLRNELVVIEEPNRFHRRRASKGPATVID